MSDPSSGVSEAVPVTVRQLAQYVALEATEHSFRVLTAPGQQSDYTILEALDSGPLRAWLEVEANTADAFFALNRDIVGAGIALEPEMSSAAAIEGLLAESSRIADDDIQLYVHPTLAAPSRPGTMLLLAAMSVVAGVFVGLCFGVLPWELGLLLAAPFAGLAATVAAGGARFAPYWGVQRRFA